MRTRHHIFDKYTLVSTLYTGAFTHIYLARHNQLETLRVIKAVEKVHAGSLRSLREAHILKTLNHPGIPIIYDVEEDDSHLYIIEEYIQGDSLKSYVSHKGHLSLSEIYQYSASLCDIVNYLHNIKPTGLLHLDIKPDNIIVSDCIKLIDYGNSIYKDEAADLAIGTVGFASPEQQNGGMTDERSDIYSIGVVILYLCTGSSDTGNIVDIGNFLLRKIVAKCINEEPAKRYQSVSSLLKDLKNIEKRKNHLSLKIVVAGSKAGIGTTHIALALTGFLVHSGYDAVYKEEISPFKKCEAPVVPMAGSSLMLHFKKQPDRNGVCLIKGCPVMPYFNQAVYVNSDRKYEITVTDLGEYKNNHHYDCDVLILVGSTAPYELEYTTRLLRSLPKSPKIIFIANLCTDSHLRLKKLTGYDLSYPFPLTDCFDTRKCSKYIKNITKQFLPPVCHTLTHIRKGFKNVFNFIKKP